MATKKDSDDLKKITITLPEELFCKLEEEAVKNQLSFDELLLRKLNKVYSEFEAHYLTNKVKNTRIDYLEKERERLRKQMYESRLYSTEQFQLECIERELEEFVPKTEEEKSLDKITKLAFHQLFSKRKPTEGIAKEIKEQKPILTEDEIEALNKTLNKRDERKIFIPQLKYDKEAYPIIRKILRKHHDKGESFKKEVLDEIYFLKVTAAQRLKNEN